jgi:hypothetical protein
MGKRDVVEEHSSRLILCTPSHFSGLTEKTHAKRQYSLCPCRHFNVFCVTVYSEGCTVLGMIIQVLSIL